MGPIGVFRLAADRCDQGAGRCLCLHFCHINRAVSVEPAGGSVGGGGRYSGPKCPWTRCVPAILPPKRQRLQVTLSGCVGISRWSVPLPQGASQSRHSYSNAQDKSQHLGGNQDLQYPPVIYGLAGNRRFSFRPIVRSVAASCYSMPVTHPYSSRSVSSHFVTRRTRVSTVQ